MRLAELWLDPVTAFAAGVTSATYAMPVVMLAAQMPDRIRPTSSQPRFGATAITM